MNEISIRKAKVDDVEVLHQLLTQLEASLEATGRVHRRPEDLLRHGFSASPLYQALIAWQDGQPVGLALFFPEFSSWRGSPGVYVQDLFVAQPARCAGLGRSLMEAVFKAAGEWGAEYCKLSVYDDNDAAISFYESLGFHIAKNERVLLLDRLP